MKQQFTRKLMLLAVMLLAGVGSSFAFEYGGLTYRVVDNDAKTVKVSYQGSNEGENPYTQSSIVIPSTVPFNGNTCYHSPNKLTWQGGIGGEQPLRCSIGPGDMCGGAAVIFATGSLSTRAKMTSLQICRPEITCDFRQICQRGGLGGGSRSPANYHSPVG